MTLDAMSPKNEGCYRYVIDSPINGGVAGGKGAAEWWLPFRATESMGSKVGSGVNNFNETNFVLLRSTVFKF